jgi:hypothetical protein
MGNGLAAGRQQRPAQQHEAPMRRWGGQSGLKYAQDWHRTIWALQALGLSWWAVSLVTQRRPLLHHDTPPFSYPKRAKVELRDRQKKANTTLY